MDGFQPCEVNELKAGTHYFAVYGNIIFCCTISRHLWLYYNLLKINHFSGDNFFKSASYTIEIVCAEPFSDQKEKLRSVEAKIIAKRSELSKFESEYREVCSSLWHILFIQVLHLRCMVVPGCWTCYKFRSLLVDIFMACGDPTY